LGKFIQGGGGGQPFFCQQEEEKMQQEFTALEKAIDFVK
jgi:hypothetical protein